MKEQEQMTKSQALKAGYTKYGFDNESYQSTRELSDIEDYEFNDPRGVMLFDIKPSYPSVDAESLLDMVHDTVVGDMDFRDDTNDVFDNLKGKVNWEEMAEKINSALREKPYYYLTNIKLVRDKVTA